MVTLKNAKLTVTISEVGAELQSIVDAAGVERVWQADPKVWASHAPNLFPVAGGLKDDAYILNGKTYPMSKHGFAKKRTFTVEAADDMSATFLLAGEAAKDPGFPYDYEFRIRYTLVDDELTCDYITDNLGKETMYYGIGGHEGYATPEGIENYEVVFDKPEHLVANELHGNLLGHEEHVILESGTVLPLNREFFAVDALVFTKINSRGVTLRSKLHDRTVHVSFSDFNYLLLWTKYCKDTPAGAPYICIEPWCNFQDWVDTDQDITKKPGIIALAGGMQDTHSHTIAIR